MARTGRPSKGDRVVVYSRPNAEVAAAAVRAAEAEGYDSLSDYVSAALAYHLGMPEHAPLTKPIISTSPATELPLTG